MEGERRRSGRRARRGDASSQDDGLDYEYAQESYDESGELAPGLRVRHPVFGPGQVIAVTGTGPSQKLKIQFERAGVKTIMVRFANLELG